MGLTSASRIAIADDGTAIGSFANAFEVESFTVKKRGVILDSSGIRGTRSIVADRVRNGGYLVEGDLVVHPSPALLDILLPYIMGANESTDSFTLGETLDSHEFALLADYGPKRVLYDDCKVNKATFKSSEGGHLELTLSIMGKTATTSATAFPSISIPTDAHDLPYLHADLALSIAGVGSRIVTEFELAIDHALRARFANSLTATWLLETDRIITSRGVFPFTSSPDATDLYEMAVAGVAMAATYTNADSSGLSLIFTAGSFHVPAEGPSLNSRNDETTLELNGQLRKSDSTMELVITSDSVA